MSIHTIPMTPAELDTLKWVSKAASKDEARPILTWTVVDTARAKVYSADGYRIHIADLTGDTLLNLNSILKTAACQVLLKVLSVGKTGKRAAVVQVTIEVCDDNLTYPNIFQFMPAPKTYTGGYAAGFNPKFLADVATRGYVTLDCQPSNTMPYTVHLHDHGGRKAIIMPAHCENYTWVKPAEVAPAASEPAAAPDQSSEIAELKADLAALNADRDRLMAELADFRKNPDREQVIASLWKELDASKAELAALKATVQPAPVAPDSDLRRENTALRGDMKKIGAEYAALKQELNDLRRENEDLRLEIDDRKGAICALFDIDDLSEQADYLTAIYDLKAELAAARHNLPLTMPPAAPDDSAALTALRAAEDKICALRNEIDDLKAAPPAPADNDQIARLKEIASNWEANFRRAQRELNKALNPARPRTA